MTPNIPIIAWAPDADPTTPGVLSDIERMLPTARGYAAEPTLGTATSFALTLTAEPHSAQTITYKAGTVPFVGVGATLRGYFGAWQDVSRTATTYVTASLYNPWRFDAFSTPANDRIALAVQLQNQLQAKTDSTAAVFGNVTAAPSADTMAVQRGFVLMGNYTTTAGTSFVDGWACSALEDYTNWTPDIATQSARGRLTSTPGQIVRLVAFQDYVVAFKRRSMYRGTYVGAAENTWSWPVVHRSVGLVSHDAVCEAEGVLYWLGFDGFYRWAGGAVQRIRSAPWTWLQGVLAGGSYIDLYTRCVWDEAQRVVRWQFYFPVAGTTDKLHLTYHPDSDRWGESMIPSPGVMFSMPPGSVYVAPLGASVYTQSPVAWFQQVGSNWVLSVPRLEPGASSLTTGDIGDDDQAFVLTRARLRTLTAGGAKAAQHLHRMNLGDALTTGETVFESDGKFDVTHSARWHRLKFSQIGNTEVTGFSVDTPRAGKR